MQHWGRAQATAPGLGSFCWPLSKRAGFPRGGTSPRGETEVVSAYAPQPRGLELKDCSFLGRPRRTPGGGRSPRALSPAGRHRCPGRGPMLPSHRAGSETRTVGKSRQDGAGERRRSIWSELVGPERCRRGSRDGDISGSFWAEQSPASGGAVGRACPGVFQLFSSLLAERGPVRANCVALCAFGLGTREGGLCEFAKGKEKTN